MPKVDNPVLVHQMFSGPIPGQSLTHAPKSMPYESPPQFAKLEDAMHWLMDTITDPPQLKQLLTLMDAGLPLEAIARTLLFSGFATGKWTPDVAILMYKPVMLTLITIAKKAGITDVPIVLPSSLDKTINNKTKLAALAAQMKGETLNNLQHQATPTPTPQPQPTQGFMQRGNI